MKATVKAEQPIMLDTLEGWGELSGLQQSTITSETKGLIEDLKQLGETRLRIGARLHKIRSILIQTKKGAWEQYITTLHISRASANRYIVMYDETAKILPAPIVEAALARGIDKIRSEVVRKFPPPAKASVVQIEDYLDKIQHEKPVRMAKERSTEELKKDLINELRKAYKDIPARSKQTWMLSFLGMCLTVMGVSNEMRLTPEAIPDSFAVVRGRPKAA